MSSLGLLNPSTREEVAKYLKSLREKKNLTQMDIAKAVNFTTPQFISTWERGEALPSREIFTKLISIINCDKDIVIEDMTNFYRIDLRTSIENYLANGK